MTHARKIMAQTFYYIMLGAQENKKKLKIFITKNYMEGKMVGI